MSETQLRQIKSIEARSSFRIIVNWEAGPSLLVDLSQFVLRGGVFEALRNEEIFSAVRIGENGALIEWPTPSDTMGYPIIDIDAEALYVLGMQQRQLANVQRALSAAAKSLEKSASNP